MYGYTVFSHLSRVCSVSIGIFPNVFSYSTVYKHSIFICLVVYSRYVPILFSCMDNLKPKKPANKTKLSRSSIKEALTQIPIERIIQGEGKNNRLTAKQRKFAEQLALGNTKAGAYREAYESEANPKAVGDMGYKLSLNPVIQKEVEAYRLALEAQKYRNAEQTKAMVIQQLTQHALNEDNPPQVRLNALRMLGQSYDVGLFVERKEITTVQSSDTIKAKLFEQLKNVIRTNAIDVADTSGDSLLAELAQAKVQDSEPTGGSGPTIDEGGMGLDGHSIPHKRSSQISDVTPNEDKNDA